MRYQICVSGSAGGGTAKRSQQLAYDVGRAISERGLTLVTGATVGLPHHAAMGVVAVKSDNRGLSVGYSPASSYREHVGTYRLPTEEFDHINFTGMEYVGRDVHLVRSCDAIITIGGRMGSLHELSTALEHRKVCGILLGSGGLADYTQILLKNVETPGVDNVIYDTDPVRLVEKVVAALDKNYADIKE